MAKRLSKPPVDAKKVAGQPVTNATIEDHRRDILGRARKFVRPIGVSRRKFVLLSAAILVVVFLLFAGAFAALIYRNQSDSNIVYRVSQALPYPAAKVGGSFVSYGDYLFEVKLQKHYFENNPISSTGDANAQPVDFSTEEGKQQLESIKNTAMQRAVEKAVIKQLAKENNVGVSKQEVDQELEQLYANEGGEKKVLETIKSFYGWDDGDLRYDIQYSVLRKKLSPIMSPEQRQQVQSVMDQVNGGGDFAKLAKKFSEDPGSKDKGGDLGFSARGAYVKEFEEAAFNLEVGQVSGIVETQYGFHIIKVTDKKDDQIKVSHILIPYRELKEVLDQRVRDANFKTYIGIDPFAEQNQQASR